MKPTLYVNDRAAASAARNSGAPRYSISRRSERDPDGSLTIGYAVLLKDANGYVTGVL